MATRNWWRTRRLASPASRRKCRVGDGQKAGVPGAWVNWGLDTILARRRRGTDRRHMAGPEAPPPVLRRQERVHENRPYDLSLDMDMLTLQGAERIAAASVRFDSATGA